jgi:hypothetical protein
MLLAGKNEKTRKRQMSLFSRARRTTVGNMRDRKKSVFKMAGALSTAEEGVFHLCLRMNSSSIRTIFAMPTEELQRNRRAMLKYDDDEDDDEEEDAAGFVDNLQNKTNADGTKLVL